LERFASGWTEEQVLENYPRLTKEDLQAIFIFKTLTLGNLKVS